MPFEGFLHRVLESGQGDPPLIRLGVPPAVAAEDRLVRGQEEPVPGTVVIELEQVEVGPGDADEADPDELIGDLIEGFGETDNLPVEFGKVPSGLAAECDEQRLAGPLGLGLGGGVVGMPTGCLRVPLLGDGGGHDEKGNDDDCSHGQSGSLTEAPLTV
jgi:hypothetical protein